MANFIQSYSNNPNRIIKQEDLQTSLNKSKQVVSDSITSNSAVKTVAGSASNSSDTKKALSILPALVVADRFVSNSMGGEEAKGLLGKMARFGDKISDIFHLDRIFSEEKSGKLSNFIKNNRFTKYFTSDYKAIPKNSMAKTEKMVTKYSQSFIDGVSGLKHDFAFANALANPSSGFSATTKKLFESVGPINKPVSKNYLEMVLRSIDDISGKIPDGQEKELISALKTKITEFLGNEVVASGAKGISTQGLADDIASVFGTLKQNPIFKAGSPLAEVSRDTQKVFSSIVQNADDAVRKIPASQLAKSADEIIAQGFDTVKKGGLTSGKVSVSELRNKLKAADMQTGKTAVGKFFAKGTLKTKDVLTYGGGLLSLYFAASAITQAIKATKEAPEGEKLSTFMHVMSEQYVGMIAFQPSINLLYKAGGNKYRGMTVEGRKALADLVSNSNAKVDAQKIYKMQKKLLQKGIAPEKVLEMSGKSLKDAKAISNKLNGGGLLSKLFGFIRHPFSSVGKMLTPPPEMSEAAKNTLETLTTTAKQNKSALKQSVKVATMQKKLLLKGVDKDAVATLGGKTLKEAKKLAKPLKSKGAKLKFWEKPLKFFGTILDTGLDTLKSPTKMGKVKTKLKGFAGGLGRFAIIMFVLQPLIQKPITKLCHKIFGKPKSYLEKQEAAQGKNAEPQLNEQMDATSSSSNETNLIDRWTVKNTNSSTFPTNIPQPSQIPASQMTMPENMTAENPTSEIPAFNLFNKKEDKQTERYIPSIQVEFNQEDKELEKRVEQILKSTDSIVKDSRKFIK